MIYVSCINVMYQSFHTTLLNIYYYHIFNGGTDISACNRTVKYLQYMLCAVHTLKRECFPQIGLTTTQHIYLKTQINIFIFKSNKNFLTKHYNNYQKKINNTYFIY